MKYILLSLFAVLCFKYGQSQQTVGLFYYSNDAYPGYTLFAPARTNYTYLIDNCGNLQFYWYSNFRVGNSVYLTEEGDLIRTCDFDNNSPLTAGGEGGRIECIQPDQSIEWFFEYSNDTVRAHHDIEIMPNGNILMIAWELKTQQEAIDHGRDPSLVGGSGLWPDHVIEYDPVEDSIVWKWHAWDHVVQDFDNTKPNYGVISDHPELFNLNFDMGNSNPDWQHMNAIAYNEELDQIILTSPFWNEIYIIDHSTTIEEAAGHTGGNSGKGGDILWRWGNPQMYDSGTPADKKLFGQHDAHWIPSDYRHGDKIILYNNGRNRTPEEYSSVDIIAPSILPNGEYEMSGGKFLPDNADYSYIDPVNPTNFFSRIISGADMLPNGNIIITEGTQGHYFEIDSLDNLVWDYVNPVVQDSILAQGQTIPGNTNLFNMTFRVRRINYDHPGLVNLNLFNYGPLERDPLPSDCETQLSQKSIETDSFFLYPSITDDFIKFSIPLLNSTYVLSGQSGKVIKTGIISGDQMNVQSLAPGVYYIKFQEGHFDTDVVYKFFKK